MEFSIPFFLSCSPRGRSYQFTAFELHYQWWSESAKEMFLLSYIFRSEAHRAPSPPLKPRTQQESTSRRSNRTENLEAANLGEDQKDKKASWEEREPWEKVVREGVEKEIRAETP